MSSKKLVNLSLFLSIALILGMIENALPPLPIPGVKLGLANIVNIILFFTDGINEALVITVLRVIAISILQGSLLSINFYISLDGAIISISSLYLLHSLFQKDVSPVSVGAVSAFSHITGQLLTVYILMNTPDILRLFPLLGLLGTLTGIITGIISTYIIKLKL
jgi:heptaprenyl diphosphate synthase